MIKIAFYISGKATRFRKIIDSVDESIGSCIALVICDNTSNRDLYAILQQRDIKFFDIDYDKLEGDRKSRNLALSDFMNDQFKKNDIDYCFCFGDHLLGGKLLSNYKNKIINFHPSILPHFPGRNAIDKALESNNLILGNTAHFINEGIDTGPVIMQNIVSQQLFQELGYDGILDQQIEMFRQIFEWIKGKRIRVIGQKVTVLGADYSLPAFFPRIEFK
jgi:phosphoribosylglycinamide formyltransferase-1